MMTNSLKQKLIKKFNFYEANEIKCGVFAFYQLCSVLIPLIIYHTQSSEKNTPYNSLCGFIYISEHMDVYFKLWKYLKIIKC